MATAADEPPANGDNVELFKKILHTGGKDPKSKWRIIVQQLNVLLARFAENPRLHIEGRPRYHFEDLTTAQVKKLFQIINTAKPDLKFDDWKEGKVVDMLLQGKAIEYLQENKPDLGEPVGRELDLTSSSEEGAASPDRRDINRLIDEIIGTESPPGTGTGSRLFKEVFEGNELYKRVIGKTPAQDYKKTVIPLLQVIYDSVLKSFRDQPYKFPKFKNMLGHRYFFEFIRDYAIRGRVLRTTYQITPFGHHVREIVSPVFAQVASDGFNRALSDDREFQRVILPKLLLLHKMVQEAGGARPMKQKEDLDWTTVLATLKPEFYDEGWATRFMATNEEFARQAHDLRSSPNVQLSTQPVEGRGGAGAEAESSAGEGSDDADKPAPEPAADPYVAEDPQFGAITLTSYVPFIKVNKRALTFDPFEAFGNIEKRINLAGKSAEIDYRSSPDKFQFLLNKISS